MTATARTVAAALLRAGLAAAVLAIVAGIFGMHVMTGNHAAHGNHAAAVQMVEGHAKAGHKAAGHHADGHAAGDQKQPASGASPASVTSCSGSCHGMQESGTSCTPSAKAGALTVFPPHESGATFQARPGARTGQAFASPYTPSSPTPCELSISRT